ncbi:hypothetical protein ABZP36_035262 [Zizania latifolia]
MLEKDGVAAGEADGLAAAVGGGAAAVRWVRMLCRELGATFVAGVVLVYGLNQGFASSFRVASDYYWKYVQRLQPATVQFLFFFFFFCSSSPGSSSHYGVLQMASAAIVAMVNGLPMTSAILVFVVISTAVVIADVTIDACIAKNGSYGRKGMDQTTKYPVLWKPSLYMFLSLALCISTHEVQFYVYTNKKPPNPGFSQEFVGMVHHAIDAVASMADVLVYHKYLKA